MPVTKKYYLLYFESSVLVLGACCCFLVFRRCLLVVHSDPSGHSAQALEALVSFPPQRVSSSSTQQPSLPPGTQRPNDVFMSVNLSIDARVTAKIRSKIIQNEFVDFGSLLVNPAFEDKFRITLQPFQEGSSPSLALEPVNKAKRITSIDVWLQAFHVYVGIFTARYPSMGLLFRIWLLGGIIGVIMMKTSVFCASLRPPLFPGGLYIGNCG